jgi:uncharacterized protein YceK
MKTFVACAATLVLSAASGCGTVMNLTEERSPTEPMSTSSKPRSPYGGVGYDLDVGSWSLLAGPIGWVECACLVVDTPLSAVADTLTLPYVLYARAQEKKAEKVDKQDREHPSAGTVIPTSASGPALP